MTSNTLDEVLTTPEAWQLWGLSVGTVRAACGRGVIARVNLPARGWSQAKQRDPIMEKVQMASKLTRCHVPIRVVGAALLGQRLCQANRTRGGLFVTFGYGVARAAEYRAKEIATESWRCSHG